MTIHEYGRNNEKIVVLVHPSVVMWDFFEYVIPLLEKEYHVIIPALPGYDEENPNEDFTSVEDMAGELDKWFIRNTICDGGITPYQLPWLLTRFIAIKDFLLISMGKIGGFGLLEKAFATDEYSKEDLKYMAKVLHFISYKTIWRTFESCNNYTMPKNPVKYPGKFKYKKGVDEFYNTYTECGICKLGIRENCFEFVPCLCNMDERNYRNEGGQLHRTKTLANGDDCCDFHVTKI